MRKSSAPSQLKKNIRAQFFSPPYKNLVPSSKRQCVGLSSVFTHEENKQSASGLLNILKNTSSDNENVSTKTPISSNSYVPGNVGLSSDPDQNDGHDIASESTPSSFQSSAKKVCCAATNNESKYFSVVWCKLSKKKHKKWEGDAVLIVKGRSVILKDMEGKEIGRSSSYKIKDLESLEEGNTLPVGSKEIEILDKIDPEKYLSGKCFQNAAISSDEIGTDIAIPVRSKPKPFRLPCVKGRATEEKENKEIKSLYDVSNVNAFVLPKPPAFHQWSCNSNSEPVADVVIDPHLGRHLRPHQKSGIIFLYEAVMGYRLKEYKGAILADEMGLGKTLQCIALIWTLLKQGPYGGKAIFKRVLIVTPSSLVSNWGKEFDKWLGKQRIQPYIVDQNNKASDFIYQKISPVLIISYEMLIRCIDVIDKANFDLILCDEGHRLKNGQIKTTTALMSLSIKRRVIVTGTPIQNDLQELYALVEFVNPEILGSSAMFRKVYEEPIMRSQQPLATEEEKQIGESRAIELNRLASQFTLRRTQETINKYLPPKTEFVVFCQPSQSQAELYQAVVGCRGLQRCLTNSEVGDHLSAICILRKLCNHPALLHVSEAKENQSEIQKEIANLIPAEISREHYLEEDSGKLAVVSCLLWSLTETKQERVVIVSNFTTTLDMLEQLCRRYDYSFLRLDGSTPSSKRQSLVDRFNSSYCKDFVFLLSSKAGGVGLNLIGASRIILYDIDWNPATDLQAMARVWRDGQKKNVFIYRLILTGSIEEKMYQRQVRKQGISGCVVDARSNVKVQFSLDELKDLFRFYPNVTCLTHDLLDCPCDQMGGDGKAMSQHSPGKERDCQLSKEANNKLKPVSMDQLFRWQHFSIQKGTDLIDDACLESANDFISFIFKYQVIPENIISV